jgi:hypothetical protein
VDGRSRSIRFPDRARAAALAALLWGAPACPYPLDGADATGIARLEGYQLAQAGKIPGPKQPPGALLSLAQVDLRLLDRPDLELPPADPLVSSQLRNLLGTEADRYGIAVLDLSDPEHPRYAEHNAARRFGPGSVGKVLVALALFQALADVYPQDLEPRRRILREATLVADGFIHVDSHKVPLWDRGAQRLRYRPIAEGDAGNLYTYLDWMLSASANAAASMIMKHAMLLRHFARAYPVSPEQAQDYFTGTAKTDLTADLARLMQDPVGRNGLDPGSLRQGSFFTRDGKRRVPGTNSYATPRELLRFLLAMEKGQLVDPFSSREMKRLLYVTQRRIRYASSPALSDAAVYFKSGSMYRCRPEADFQCRKYQGNVENWMNSVAIVEAPAESRDLHYLVVVMSNVLRQNSAVEHQTLATRLHRLIERYHAARQAAPAGAE